MPKASEYLNGKFAHLVETELEKYLGGPGAVANACNPSTLGDRGG